MLVYHEKEIKEAEKALTDIMISKFGRVRVTTVEESFRSRFPLDMPKDILYIFDEADAVFIDQRRELSGQGRVLGLTATGLTASTMAERDFLLSRKFHFMSSGIDTGLNFDEVQKVDNLATFFSDNVDMAKLIYVG